MQPMIVLIEDDEYIREAFQEILEDEGFEVRAFRHGREAVEGLRQTQRPGLIFLDWMMPVMSGAEFVKAREQLEDTILAVPIVVVSAVAEEVKPAPGIRAVVKKPLDIDRLISLVHEYCEKPAASQVA